MTTLAEIERDAIRASLERHGWNRRAVARELGIARSTLIRKLDEHGLRGSKADRIAMFRTDSLKNLRGLARSFAEEDSSLFISMLVVLAVSICGPDAKAIAAYIRVPPEEVEIRAARLRANGIWNADGWFDAWWIEDAEAHPDWADAAAWLDSMVAEGAVIRGQPSADGRPTYALDPEFKAAYEEAFAEGAPLPALSLTPAPLALPPHTPEPQPELERSQEEKLAELRARGFGGGRR